MVHAEFSDELCPPNKRYDLMDANKKIDFEQVQCPPESKLLTNIIKNHPLRFSIAASSSVPWIYMAQFWHTLKEDGSKYRLTFMLDKKDFVPPPSFLDMVPFYKNELGFTMELKTSSSFKTTGLLQPWQTLCKIFSKCLTTRVTRWDQPPLKIMQLMYCFINNIHVDYTELLWEGLHYSLHHPTSSIPYPRFTKIIISHYMTNFPKISRHAQDRSVKCSKMINCDSFLYSSKEIQKPPQSYSTSSVPTVDKAENDFLTRPITNPKSDKESPEVEITNDEERREKGKILEESRSTPFPTPIRSPRIHTELGCYGYLFEHLRAKFLSRKSFDTLADHLQEVMVESLPTMVDKHIKEQVEKQVPEQVKVQVPVYVAKGLLLERQQNKEETDKMIAKAMLQERGKLQTEISSQIQNAIDTNIPSLVDASVRSYMSGHILHVHPAQPQTTSVPEQQYQLYLSMKADPQLQQQDIAIWLALQMKFEKLQVPQTTCRTHVVRPRDQDDPHDDAHPEGKNSAKRHKTSKVLEGLKSYNNDVKYGYIQRDLTQDEVEYLKLFEEEIENSWGPKPLQT
ncbi:hypothetical protein Tco_0943510 [Tanacetum coccineum]